MSDKPDIDPATEKRILDTLAAMLAVKDDAKGQRGVIGEIPCKACGDGTIAYSVAKSNGHTMAHCSTDGCLSWIE